MSTRLAVVAPWVLVVGLVAVAWSSTLPVRPVGADADPALFSAERAMVHVEAIAREPHPMGSAAIERVRDHIVGAVDELGLEVELQSVPARDVFGDGGPIDAVNVIAWIPGTDNTRAVVLVGHHDTVPTTPGGNDNSAAVAAMLETARALQAGPPLANDVVFLFTDGEEPSDRFGATGFAAVPGLVDSLGIVVNLEAIGSTGASTLVETNGSQSWLVGGYAAAAPAPAAYSFLTETTGLIDGDISDFDVFRAADLPGMHFVYLRGSPIYHTMDDDIDSVGLGSLQHHGDNVLAVARHFGDLDLTTVPDADTSVFFTVRPFLVRYPTVWAPVLAAAAIGLLAVALVGHGRRGSLRPRGVARAAAASVLGAVVGASVGTVAWLAFTGVRSSPSIWESYLALGVLGAGAVLAARWVGTRMRGVGDETARHGVAVVWASLAVVTAVALPGFSHLFVFPAIAAIVGLLWRPASSGWAQVRFAVVAIPTLLLVTPAVDHLFVLAQPHPGNPGSQVTAAAVVPLLLAVLAVDLMDKRWHLPDEGGSSGEHAPAGEAATQAAGVGPVLLDHESV